MNKMKKCILLLALVASLVSCKSNKNQILYDRYVMVDIKGYENIDDFTKPFSGWTKNHNYVDPDIIYGGIVYMVHSYFLRSSDNFTFISREAINGVWSSTDLIEDYTCYLYDEKMSDAISADSVYNFLPKQKLIINKLSNIENSHKFLDAKYMLVAVRHSKFTNVTKVSIPGISPKAYLRCIVSVSQKK